MVAMMSFMDSQSFKWGDDNIPRYDKELGEKEGMMYKNKKWSDVLMDGVSLESIIELENKYMDMKMVDVEPLEKVLSELEQRYGAGRAAE